MTAQNLAQSDIFLSELRDLLPLIVLPLKTPANLGEIFGFLEKLALR